MFKNMKWNSLLMSIGYIAGGAFLIMFSTIPNATLCNIVGGIVIVVGVIHIVNYMIMDIRKALYRGDFVEGVIMIFIGILIIYENKTFSDVVSSILALFIIIGGFSLFQDAIDSSRLGFKGSWLYTLLGIVPVVYGILILFGVLPSVYNIPLYAMIGGGLIYCGIVSFFSSLHLSGRIAKYIKELEKGHHSKEEQVKDEGHQETVFVPETDENAVLEDTHTMPVPTADPVVVESEEKEETKEE